MYLSNKIYNNRYKVQYSFKKVNDNTYLFVFPENELKYCRIGSNNDQNSIDYQNLGFIDPSGGPFITLNTGIDHKKITRIYFAEDKNIYFEVKE